MLSVLESYSSKNEWHPSAHPSQQSYKYATLFDNGFYKKAYTLHAALLSIHLPQSNHLVLNWSRHSFHTNKQTHRYINPHAPADHFHAQPHAQKSQSDSWHSAGTQLDKGQMGPAYLLSGMSVVLFVQPSPLISSLPSQTPQTFNRLIVAQIYIAFSYFLIKVLSLLIFVFYIEQAFLISAVQVKYDERKSSRNIK